MVPLVDLGAGGDAIDLGVGGPVERGPGGLMGELKRWALKQGESS